MTRRFSNASESSFDAIVIGGGSGGLSFANKFAGSGFKIRLFDFVPPTPFGNKWGLGGTCVNVGCIPKKLFHAASIRKQLINEAKNFGFQLNEEPSYLISFRHVHFDSQCSDIHQKSELQIAIIVVSQFSRLQK